MVQFLILKATQHNTSYLGAKQGTQCHIPGIRFIKFKEDLGYINLQVMSVILYTVYIMSSTRITYNIAT